MNSQTNPTISIRVDVTNPGQFFACCGLAELAERILQRNLLCWFAGQEYSISMQSDGLCRGSLQTLLGNLEETSLKQADPDDETASPILISGVCELRLDWWQDVGGGGNALKTWAGSQNVYRIATAMQNAFSGVTNMVDCLNYSAVVYDPNAPDKKVEPFYFDSRRGAKPFSRDIGFAPDALQMTTPAYPVVEYLCLVGLQRCRPSASQKPRVFDYHTWQTPLPVSAMPAAVCGLLPGVGVRGFRFENAFRTDQRKHKAFSPAIPLPRRTS
jgi:hypothetical protein